MSSLTPRTTQAIFERRSTGRSVKDLAAKVDQMKPSEGGDGERLSTGGNPMGGNGEQAGPSGEPSMQKLKYSLRREATGNFKPIPAAKFTELMNELKGAG